MAGRTLQDWLLHQQSVHPRGIDLTLARVREVARRMDLERPGFPVITVAGTNGKGSTVEYSSRLLTVSGHRCGAFTSPHLLAYNERIRVDGAMASDDELVAAFERIEEARGEVTLTFFEFNLLAALWVFRERSVAAAVLEVGLGGRLDAANLVDADVAVVTSIGLDHRDWLGDTLEDIGREKAGIFRAGRPAVLADPAMTPAVAAQAARIGARALVAGRDYTWRREERTDDGRWELAFGARRWRLPPPGLAGEQQYANAAAAIVAVTELGNARGLAIDDGGAGEAIRGARLAGRFQRIPGDVEWILDVAHNEPAAQLLAAQLAREPVKGRRWTIAGILGDKDIDAVARALAPVTDEWVLCGIDDPRGLAPEALRARSPAFARALTAVDVAAAIARVRASARPGDRVVVCGSFLTVAPALAALGVY